MKLKDLITPSIMHKTKFEDSYQFRPVINNISERNNNFLIKYNCGDYIVEFQFEGGLKLNNNIRIYCSCMSFNFEFAHILNDVDALLYPTLFKKALYKTPTKKNKYNLIGGCKHCIACARLTYSKFDLLQLKETKR